MKKEKASVLCLFFVRFVDKGKFVETDGEPVLSIVGEVKKTRKPFNYIKKELNYYLRSIDSSTLKYLSIAYEPNWAIGTGEIQCIDKIQSVIEDIKLYVYKRYKINIEVYYGGSVDENNIKDIFNISDGIVLGKASIDIDELNKILNGLKND